MSTKLRPNRFDSVNLVLGKNVQETAQGFLRIPAYTARTGIQKYRMDDGTVLKEYRPESEVFSEASISSLETAAVTDGHPSEMVNPDNARELVVGYPFGGVRQEKDDEEKYLATDLIITHRSAIDAIKAGKAQLSNGYHVDLDFTKGVYKNDEYDAVQKNIVNNHIAIVWRARGGNEVRLRLDSDQAILINDENEGKPKKESNLMKVKIGDKEFEMSDEAGNAVKDMMAKHKKDMGAMKSKNDNAETEIEVLKSQKSNLVAKVDSVESDLEKAKTAQTEIPAEKLDAAVKERVSVLDAGKKMLTKEEIEKIDSMSNDDIKKAVIKADSPKVDEEKLKDAGYVDARFDHIVENWSEGEDASKKVGDNVAKTRTENTDENNDDGYKTPEQIRAENMEKARKDSLGPKGE